MIVDYRAGYSRHGLRQRQGFPNASTADTREGYQKRRAGQETDVLQKAKLVQVMRKITRRTTLPHQEHQNSALRTQMPRKVTEARRVVVGSARRRRERTMRKRRRKRRGKYRRPRRKEGLLRRQKDHSSSRPIFLNLRTPPFCANSARSL